MGAFGAIIGSFLNVVAYRVPIGKSVVHPPSACPDCGHQVRARDNVPVLSWLLLRGRCRDCRSAISWRYPVVEAATGVFFAVVAWWSWTTGPGAAQLPGAAVILVAYLCFAGLSVALALIDLDVHRLPDVLVLPGIAVGVVLLGTGAILTGDLGALLRALVGAAGLFVFYLVVALAKPGGMGFGDVKLAGLVGLFLGFQGWSALLVGAFAAFLVGGAVAIVLLALRRLGRRDGIPFGPWMLLGAWLGLFFGEPIGSAYLTLIGPR
ncbi:prepilin peptidase [Leifsonia shinshuensis]|uniref:prepilin peptidase n=1 Tax=Leifsonia shinshuensis TaxID=150026 RepID=UPI0028561D72|nr:prepilin peptidase [Leifsonia shinshuensis]MDR6971505.1 leader peptidase (prepilin peptidase)/N-methyltransferase [Leifsonia shinshuensis]